jgi:putative hydrolase of HD superfamily
MVEFFVLADQLKGVDRRNRLADGSRVENTAEHSWHLALGAMVFHELAEPGTDLFHSIRLALVHDVVEIDAGDTFAYDSVGAMDKADRERRAADRIFGILPDDLGQQFRSWWDEFEEGATPEAKFAAALDRMAPMVLNMVEGATTWREHGVSAEAATARNKSTILAGLPAVWPLLESSLAISVEHGELSAS